MANQRNEQFCTEVTDERCSHFSKRWFSKLIYVIQFWKHHYVTGEMGGFRYCHQISLPRSRLWEGWNKSDIMHMGFFLSSGTMLQFFCERQLFIFAKLITEVVSEYNSCLISVIVLHKAVHTHSLHIKRQGWWYFLIIKKKHKKTKTNMNWSDNKCCLCSQSQKSNSNVVGFSLSLWCWLRKI